MGTIGLAPSPRHRWRRTSPVRWIVSALLALALVIFAAYELGRGSRVDRSVSGAPAAGTPVAAAVAVGAGPPPTRSPSPSAQGAGSAIASPTPVEERPLHRAEPTPELVPASVEHTPEAPPPFTAQRPAGPSCAEQGSRYLDRVESVVFRFEREKEIAQQTPRIDLSGRVSKLEELFQETGRVQGWPDPVCEFRIRKRLITAEAADVEMFKRFLGQESIDAASALSRESWADFEREKKEIRRLFQAEGGGSFSQ